MDSFFALLISIGAIALYMMQHLRALEENVVVKQDEMLLTVPAGTGRVAMEQLLIKIIYSTKAIIFKFY